MKSESFGRIRLIYRGLLLVNISIPRSGFRPARLSLSAECVVLQPDP